MQTFNGWMEIAREKLRNCLPEARSSFVRTLVDGFVEDVNHGAIEMGMLQDPLEVQGRLLAYCDNLANTSSPGEES